ncbi:hypothetical protein CAEBREN_30636 [Caenorhabditis brenneri]|uniref:IgGFc-binding protein N-terminal domain-containing protein n=1 Tax=Caenorhabditis brenneri TaxID=135651 RepID=G0PCR9_CAEBE|nr:hypothetical protein CAEBREN_30636 [Caenorhabditis brenneri]
MKLAFLFFCLTLSINSKPLLLASVPQEIPVQEGTRLYFLTSGPEAELKGFTVKAAKNNIDSNVFAYSVPETDGSLSPLTITVNDTLIVTRPEGSTSAVKLYQDRITQSLNVFPVFEKSSIGFKSGKNVFFAVEKPNGKILTIQNLKVDPQNNGYVRGYSGVPGDLIPQPYMFFNSDVYQSVNFYQQLDIPIDEFSMDPVFTGVSYTVSFGQVTTTLQSSGLIMTPNYPLTLDLSDITFNINRVGDESVSLHMNPFFYRDHVYTTFITVNFGFGIQQENSFPSQLDGRMNAAGTMNSVEVRSSGAYAIQYYTNSTSTNALGTTLAGQGTTPSIITTTGSSSFIHTCLSFGVVFVSLLIR